LISSVTGEAIDVVWDQLSPQIERALKHGAGDATSSEFLRQFVKRGDAVMWAIHGESLVACIVVSVRQHPCKRTVFVELVAGSDLDQWIDEIEETLIKYRDLTGSDTIEASCRHGLAGRLMRRDRWARKAILMELK